MKPIPATDQPGVFTVIDNFNPVFNYYPFKQYKDVDNDGDNDLIAISKTHCYVVPWRYGIYDYNLRKDSNQIYFNYSQKYIFDMTGDGFLDFIGIEGPHRYIVPGNEDCYFPYEDRIYDKLW